MLALVVFMLGFIGAAGIYVTLKYFVIGIDHVTRDGVVYTEKWEFHLGKNGVYGFQKRYIV